MAIVYGAAACVGALAAFVVLPCEAWLIATLCGPLSASGMALINAFALTFLSK